MRKRKDRNRSTEHRFFGLKEYFLMVLCLLTFVLIIVYSSYIFGSIGFVILFFLENWMVCLPFLVFILLIHQLIKYSDEDRFIDNRHSKRFY